jgi:hypothetical protein
MNARTFIISLCGSLLSLSTGAHAAVVSYAFETAAITEQRGGVTVGSDEQLFAPGLNISASFDYDNAASREAIQPQPWGTLYRNVENISASVGGFYDVSSFTGWTFVSNDGFVPTGSTDSYDALWVQANPNPVAPPLPGSPQLSDGTGELFALQDIRFLWLENQSGVDFLSDETLPEGLIGLPDPGGIALIFKPVDSGSSTGQHVVVAPITSVRVVPIPGAVWLLGSGLGALAWFRRAVL